MTRTREEITREIERLETLMFYLKMKDRWDAQDYGTMNEWRREVRNLKAELKKIA